jgi:predicted MFS family arabinose efflux permease
VADQYAHRGHRASRAAEYSDSEASAILTVYGISQTVAVLGLGAVTDVCRPEVLHAVGISCFVISMTSQVTLATLYSCGADKSLLRHVAVVNTLLTSLGHALPYDLGPSFMSMRLGGSKHAPMLIGTIETPGFFVGAIFTALVGTSIEEHHDFNTLLWTPAACLLLGNAAWWALVVLDAKRPLQIQVSSQQ